MTAPTCIRCGKPTDALICHDDAQELAERLMVAAGHAEDADAVIARQVRYAAGSRGGSGDGTKDPNLTAATELHTIADVITRWALKITDATGRRPRWRPQAGPLCPPTGERCLHDSCAGIRRQVAASMTPLQTGWLSRQTDWLRKHHDADRAFRELHDACDHLARLVDRPADKQLVGMCDCGKTLYAPDDKTVLQCPEKTCRLVWNVEESRDILRRNLGDKLVTVARAARLAAYLDPDRTQDGIRKLIAARVRSGLLVAHVVDGEEPTYRFREVAAVLATIPKRSRDT